MTAGAKRKRSLALELKKVMEDMRTVRHSLSALCWPQRHSLYEIIVPYILYFVCGVCVCIGTFPPTGRGEES